MDQILDTMNNLLAIARRLNKLTTIINQKLTIEGLIELNELNEQFNREIQEIDVGAHSISSNLHKWILEKGMEPRVRVERRAYPPPNQFDRRKI